MILLVAKDRNSNRSTDREEGGKREKVLVRWVQRKGWTTESREKVTDRTSGETWTMTSKVTVPSSSLLDWFLSALFFFSHCDYIYVVIILRLIFYSLNHQTNYPSSQSRISLISFLLAQWHNMIQEKHSSFHCNILGEAEGDILLQGKQSQSVGPLVAKQCSLC